MASPALEEFIDETIRRAAARGYHPTVFVGMRQKYGTVAAISRLVASADVQYGFQRLADLGLIDWSIEAAVMKFPDEFSKGDRASAEWRLKQVKRRDDNA